MGLAILLSITAEAEQEPLAGASVFAPNGIIEAAGALDRALSPPPGRSAPSTRTASRSDR